MRRPHPACNTPYRVPIYDDIGISTGAYANFSLAAALLRIGEIAPAAEILSLGRHSLLDAANARVIELSGLPFTVHGPFLHFEYGSRSARQHRAALDDHRRHLAVAAELGARVYVVHPDLQRRFKGWDRRVVKTLESSFERARGAAGGVRRRASPSRTCPSCGTRTSARPDDLDLRGLGLSLDVGHAAVAGTLAAWLTDGRYELNTCTCTTTKATWAATSTSRWGAASSTPRRSWSSLAPPAPWWCSSTRTKPT